MKKLLLTIIFAAATSFLFSSNAFALNLLNNASFATSGTHGAITTLTSTVTPPPGAFGYSAAASWTTWNNTFGTTTTELLTSTFDTNKMIHVTTNGKANGIVQRWAPINTGPANVMSSVWVYVLQGQVGMGTGNGGHTSNLDAVSTGTGYWQLLQAANSISPANEFIVYSTSIGGAEYYVDAATVNAVPEPSTLLLLGSGLTALGFIRRKFKA